MDDLKQILVDRQVEIVLQQYYLELGQPYEEVKEEEKKALINIILPTINMDIEKMLREYVEYSQATKPDKKNNKKFQILLAGLLCIVMVGLAYAVNIENWILVVILVVINIVLAIAPIFFED